MSKSVGLEEDNEGQEVEVGIEDIFCKDISAATRSPEPTLTITDEVVVEPKMETTRQFLKSGNGSQVPVRLRRHDKNYQVNWRRLFRRKGSEMRLVPPVVSPKTIISSYHEKIWHWGIRVTGDFIEESFWRTAMCRDVLQQSDLIWHANVVSKIFQPITITGSPLILFSKRSRWTSPAPCYRRRTVRNMSLLSLRT